MKIFNLLVLLFLFSVCQAQTYSVEDFGAKPDGKTNNTRAIQWAIDSCSRNNGGIVEFSSGTYLSGTIHLKSNVSLKIDPNSILKAVADTSALNKVRSSIISRMDVVSWKAFIHADSQKNIRIFGGGKIDASGDALCFIDGIENSPNRHYGLFFINCENVIVENLQLQSSAFWLQRYFNCRKLRLNKLNVFNHVNKNNDGVDIDSSEDVIISDCIIDSSDDGICIKSEGENPAKNIVVSNCIISSHASAIKLGTGSVGGFENITISNCVIRRSKSTEMLHPMGVWGGLSGIDIATTDGGALRQVMITNITMEDVENPIHIRLGNRLSGNVSRQGYGVEADKMQGVKGNENTAKVQSQFVLEDVTLSNVLCKNVGPYPIIVAGFEGQPVKRITLRDITLVCGRPGIPADITKKLNWKANGYPGRGMYGGHLPAYGIVSNFTEDLVLENVKAIPATGEVRPFEKHWNRNVSKKQVYK